MIKALTISASLLIVVMPTTEQISNTLFIILAHTYYLSHKLPLSVAYITLLVPNLMK